MTNIPSARHVQQVAELIKRLTPDEIQELLHLVPWLRAASATAGQEDEADKRDPLVEWAREQMAQYVDEAHPMQAEDDFLADTTVADYFARPEDERERIWAELYTIAIESAPEREVNPDAAP